MGLTLLGLLGLAAGPLLGSANDPRLDNFRRRVGFVSFPVPAPGTGVVADWRELATLPLLQGWHAEELAVFPDRESIRSRWALRRGAQHLIVDLGVASEPREARAIFWSTLAATNMQEIPGERLVPSVGDFSISLGSDSGISRLHWVSNNVVVSLAQVEGQGDLLTLGRQIQEFIETNLRPDFEEFRPRIATFDLSPPSLKVGEVSSLLFEVVAGAERPHSTPRVMVEPDHRVVIVDGQIGAVWRLLAVIPGQSPVTAVGYDPETLLSVTESTVVTVSALPADL